MLRKLLKYDLREMLRRSYPFFAASGAVSLLCCALMYFSRSFQEESGFGFFTAISFYGIGIFAIVVLLAINMFFAVARYYKSFFTDEGYLYMVIPTDTKKLLIGKIMSAYIWIFSSIVVGALSLFIAVALPNMLYDPRGFFSLLEGFGAEGLFPEFMLGLASSVLSGIQFLITILENITIIFASITVGSMMMSKHRIVGSVLFYFVISFVQSSAMTVVEILILGLLMTESAAGYIISQLIGLLVSVAISVVMYFLNLHYLKNRFNIE